jgi:hypothetical protein
MVILVLCQRETTAEQECRENLRLLELNLFDNPFLRATCRGTVQNDFLSINKIGGQYSIIISRRLGFDQPIYQINFDKCQF